MLTGEAMPESQLGWCSPLFLDDKRGKGVSISLRSEQGDEWEVQNLRQLVFRPEELRRPHVKVAESFISNL